MARKIKEVYKITKTLLNKIERLAKKGLYINQIAVSIGWNRDTLFKRIKDSPDVADAIKRGQTSNIKELTSAIHRRAKGYKYTETHKEIKTEGKNIKSQIIKKVEKHEAPNVTAGIFLLTNLDPENWKHKSEQVLSGELAMTVGAIKKEDVKKVKDIFDNITE